MEQKPITIVIPHRAELHHIGKPANGLPKVFEASKVIKSYKADQEDEIPNEGP